VVPVSTSPILYRQRSVKQSATGDPNRLNSNCLQCILHTHTHTHTHMMSYRPIHTQGFPPTNRFAVVVVLYVHERRFSTFRKFVHLSAPGGCSHVRLRCEPICLSNTCSCQVCDNTQSLALTHALTRHVSVEYVLFLICTLFVELNLHSYVSAV